ncbi:hypothetical protein GJ744_001539 [Endocarpon pusillum]|uniref:Uncharacterized protein n=1 Tax=Endocarpon pusillum TaxID=364733 RepID=A0A8H7E1T3_9EURO|nr:hypothetical protein GJ744_001539 [Endocarpon pusillum]
MACYRPGMSITLPRNFAPMGLDSLDEPKTPEQLFSEATLPPPPHHTTQRIRRSRIGNFSSNSNVLPTVLFASDIPIPSVEVPRDTGPIRPTWQQRIMQSSPSDRLQLPTNRHHSRPKTPLAQTKAEEPNWKSNAWTMDRPSSSLSMRSDSSSSSLESFVSRPSFGGSCTSPESDMTDPFMPQAINVISDTPSKPSRIFTSFSTVPTKPRWTTEQDNHIWNTYQMYLSDPTITPFKTVPGSLPPLGVCHRVAREARRTWPKATRIPHEIVRRHTFRDVMDESSAVRDKTPEGVRETTPTESSQADRRAPWPKESATRRRLKELCKRKFSIAPHYQRLMQSRSPSPFLESGTHRSSSRASRQSSLVHETTASYTTRDLGISLVASGATAPLAQLVTGDSPPKESEEWFNTPIEPPSSSPPIAATSQLGLGINSDSMTIPRLASPFKPNTWGPSRARRNPSGSGQFDTVHATGPRLFSPCRFDPVSSTANKQRAEQHFNTEVSPDGGDSQQAKQEFVFTGSSNDINQRRIRLRNRGSTVGAVSNRERIEKLFTPPGTLQEPLGENSTSSPNVKSTLMPPETEEKLKRLGSPFELDPNKRSNRSKTPRHVPSLSDPFVSNPFSTQSNTQSIGERLAAFGAMQGHNSQNVSQLGENLSDAERIRQQLLSSHHPPLYSSYPTAFAAFAQTREGLSSYDERRKACPPGG